MNNVQLRVREVIDANGGLWPRDKILLKLTEELGELAQAFRKKTRVEQFKELGDLGLALCCLAECEGFTVEAAILDSAKRFNDDQKAKGD